MNYLLDQFFILILCSYSIPFMAQPLWCVTAFLITVTYGCCSYCYEKKMVFSFLTITFLLLCIVNPYCLFFTPIVVYEAFYHNKLQLLFLFIPYYTLFLTISGIKELIYVLLLCIISLFFYEKTRRLEALNYKFKLYRDDSTERSLLLKKSNRELIERQNLNIQTATLAERNRIAREIHDNVGHMLSRCLLQIGAMQTIYKEEPLQSNLNSIKDTLTEAMNNIRTSVHNLYEESIDLKATIEKLITDFSAYEITLDYDIHSKLSNDLKYCFITIIKEALNNVVKHSTADKINIIAREHPVFYQLVFEDNGKSKTAYTFDGIGLDNMKTRVTQLNGTFKADSLPSGFRIFITIPKQH